jgi:histidinol-phosphatase (PHP family)
MNDSWKVSLHGGHSGDFCAHGNDTLVEMLDAAVEFGYSTYGVTAHSPRTDDRFLYPEEIEAGLGTHDIARFFDEYVGTCSSLIDQYRGRLEVLLGAEIEVVPERTYPAEVTALRERYGLDYVVGSVHWVDETPIDTSDSEFSKAVTARGGLQPFLIRYYDLVGEMVETVRPEVIGHIDLPRLFAEGGHELESASTRAAVADVLERALASGGILDINVRAMSKGLSTPYPAPWIVQLATEIGVPLCFGDDSHSASGVGVGLEAGREYLLGLGVERITRLTRVSGGIAKQDVSL